MGIIALLIFISLSIAIVFLLIFYWSMKSGQYEDTYTPSVRMLFEDKKVKQEPIEKPDKILNNNLDSFMEQRKAPALTTTDD